MQQTMEPTTHRPDPDSVTAPAPNTRPPWRVVVLEVLALLALVCALVTTVVYLVQVGCAPGRARVTGRSIDDVLPSFWWWVPIGALGIGGTVLRLSAWRMWRTRQTMRQALSRRIARDVRRQRCNRMMQAGVAGAVEEDRRLSAMLRFQAAFEDLPGDSEFADWPALTAAWKDLVGRVPGIRGWLFDARYPFPDTYTLPELLTTSPAAPDGDPTQARAARNHPGSDHDQAASTLRDAHTAFAALEQAWLDYITDPEAYFLKRPLLRVRENEPTRRYEDARFDAYELLQAHPAGAPVDIRTADSVLAAVEHAWECWDAANSHALRVGLDPFTSTERTALRRAGKLVALIADPAVTRAERDTYIAELRRQLDELHTAPAAVTDIRRMPALERVIDQLELGAK